jgi:hypothetical protein
MNPLYAHAEFRASDKVAFSGMTIQPISRLACMTFVLSEKAAGRNRTAVAQRDVQEDPGEDG